MREAQHLVEMRKKHPNLEIAAATMSTDKAAIAGWLAKVGADLAILNGVSDATIKAYGVTNYPTLRVLAKDGSVAGSDQAALEKILAEG